MTVCGQSCSCAPLRVLQPAACNRGGCATITRFLDDTTCGARMAGTTITHLRGYAAYGAMTRRVNNTHGEAKAQCPPERRARIGEANRNETERNQGSPPLAHYGTVVLLGNLQKVASPEGARPQDVLRILVVSNAAGGGGKRTQQARPKRAHLNSRTLGTSRPIV